MQVEFTDHGDHFRIHVLRQTIPCHGDVIDNFIETRAFDFFTLQIADAIGKVKDDTALR